MYKLLESDIRIGNWCNMFLGLVQPLRHRKSRTLIRCTKENTENVLGISSKLLTTQGGKRLFIHVHMIDISRYYSVRKQDRQLGNR